MSRDWEGNLKEGREKQTPFASLSYRGFVFLLSHPTPKFGATTMTQQTSRQAALTKEANRLLRKSGFYKAAAKRKAWMRNPVNRAWAQAANPAAISADGHLSGSKAFC